jgi:glutamate 5-kinase
MDPTRKQHLNTIRTVVIKLGTQLLSDEDGRLDAAYVGEIARQVAELRERKIGVTIVSSGAVGAGLRVLNLAKRPSDLGKLQAVAAVGQRRLMDVWADAFEPFKLPVAQILLTREDIDDRTRFLNVRNTIHSAQALGAIPIVNENDTISTDEIVKITFGDNDILASLVASALRADLLVLLTSVNGVLDACGATVPLIENVERGRELVRAEKSAAGKGGMNSKFAAAKTVTDAGEVLIVANGRDANVLPRLLEGEALGTLFVPSAKKRSSRGRWIGAARPAGSIYVDDGATIALTQRNRSLLAAGITKVNGVFVPGDVVSIVDGSGREIARGLTNYASEDARKVCGKKTSEVHALLGDGAYDEVVHRDNLVLC